MAKSDDFVMTGVVEALRSNMAAAFASQPLEIPVNLKLDTKQVESQLSGILERVLGQAGTAANARVRAPRGGTRDAAVGVTTLDPSAINALAQNIATAVANSVDAHDPGTITAEVRDALRGLKLGFDELAKHLATQTTKLQEIKTALTTRSPHVTVDAEPAVERAPVRNEPPARQPDATASDALARKISVLSQFVSAIGNEVHALKQTGKTGFSSPSAAAVGLLTPNEFSFSKKLKADLERIRTGGDTKTTEAALNRLLPDVLKSLESQLKRAQQQEVALLQSLESLSTSIEENTEQMKAALKQQRNADAAEDKRTDRELVKVVERQYKLFQQALQEAQQVNRRDDQAVMNAVKRVAITMEGLLGADRADQYLGRNGLTVDPSSGKLLSSGDAVPSEERLETFLQSVGKLSKDAALRMVRELGVATQTASTGVSTPLEKAGKRVADAADGMARRIESATESIAPPEGVFDWKVLFSNLTAFSNVLVSAVERISGAMPAAGAIPSTWTGLNAQRTQSGAFVWTPGATAPTGAPTPFVTTSGPVIGTGNPSADPNRNRRTGSSRPADIRILNAAMAKDPELRKAFLSGAMSYDDLRKLYNERQQASGAQMVAAPSLDRLIDWTTINDPVEAARTKVLQEQRMAFARRDLRKQMELANNRAEQSGDRQARLAKVYSTFQEQNPALYRMLVQGSSRDAVAFPTEGFNVPVLDGANLSSVQINSTKDVAQQIVRKELATLRRGLAQLVTKTDVPISITQDDVVGQLVGDPSAGLSGLRPTAEVRQAITALYPDLFATPASRRELYRADPEVAQTAILKAIQEGGEFTPQRLTSAIKTLGFRTATGERGAFDALSKLLDFQTGLILDPESTQPRIGRPTLPALVSEEEAKQAQTLIKRLLSRERAAADYEQRAQKARGARATRLQENAFRARQDAQEAFDQLQSVPGVFQRAGTLEEQDREELARAQEFLYSATRPQTTAAQDARRVQSYKRRIAEKEAELRGLTGASPELLATYTRGEPSRLLNLIREGIASGRFKDEIGVVRSTKIEKDGTEVTTTAETLSTDVLKDFGGLAKELQLFKGRPDQEGSYEYARAEFKKLPLQTRQALRLLDRLEAGGIATRRDVERFNTLTDPRAANILASSADRQQPLTSAEYQQLVESFRVGGIGAAVDFETPNPDQLLRDKLEQLFGLGGRRQLNRLDIDLADVQTRRAAVTEQISAILNKGRKPGQVLTDRQRANRQQKISALGLDTQLRALNAAEADLEATRRRVQREIEAEQESNPRAGLFEFFAFGESGLPQTGYNPRLVMQQVFKMADAFKNMLKVANSGQRGRPAFLNGMRETRTNPARLVNPKFAGLNAEQIDVTQLSPEVSALLNQGLQPRVIGGALSNKELYQAQKFGDFYEYSPEEVYRLAEQVYRNEQLIKGKALDEFGNRVTKRQRDDATYRRDQAILALQQGGEWLPTGSEQWIDLPRVLGVDVFNRMERRGGKWVPARTEAVEEALAQTATRGETTTRLQADRERLRARLETDLTPEERAYFQAELAKLTPTVTASAASERSDRTRTPTTPTGSVPPRAVRPSLDPVAARAAAAIEADIQARRDELDAAARAAAAAAGVNPGRAWAWPNQGASESLRTGSTPWARRAEEMWRRRHSTPDRIWTQGGIGAEPPHSGPTRETAAGGSGGGGIPPTPPPGGVPGGVPFEPGDWERLRKEMLQLVPAVRTLADSMGVLRQSGLTQAGQAALLSNIQRSRRLGNIDLDVERRQRLDAVKLETLRAKLTTEQEFKQAPPTVLPLPNLGLVGPATQIPAALVLDRIRQTFTESVSQQQRGDELRRMRETGLLTPVELRRNLRASRKLGVEAEVTLEQLAEAVQLGGTSVPQGRYRSQLASLTDAAARIRSETSAMRPDLDYVTRYRQAEARAASTNPQIAAAGKQELEQVVQGRFPNGAAQSIGDIEKTLIEGQGRRKVALNELTVGLQNLMLQVNDDRKLRGFAAFTDRLRSLSVYAGAGMVLFTTINALRNTFRQVVELEAELAQVFGILGDVQESSKRVIETSVIESAQRFGVTVGESLQTYKLFAQAGVGRGAPAEVARFTEASLLGARAAGLQPQQSQELLLAMNAISGGTANPFDVLDRISQVERQYAVTAQDLALAIQRVGAVATQLQPSQQAGISATDLISGLQTAVVETTRVGGNQAATSLRFILARLGSPRITRQLQDEFGIELGGETPDEFRPLQDILASIAQRYGELRGTGDQASPEAVRLLATVGGARQIAAATAVFDNWNKVMQVANESASAFGDAARRLALQQETLQYQTRQIGVQWLDFTNQVIRQSGFLDGLKVITRWATGAGVGTEGGGFGRVAVGAAGLAGLAVYGPRLGQRLQQQGTVIAAPNEGAPQSLFATGVGSAAGAAAGAGVARAGAGAALTRFGGLLARFAASTPVTAAASIGVSLVAGSLLGRYSNRARGNLSTEERQAEQLEQFLGLDQVQQFDAQAAQLRKSPGQFSQELLAAQAAALRVATGGRSAQELRNLPDAERQRVRPTYDAELQRRLAPIVGSLAESPEQIPELVRSLVSTAGRQRRGFAVQEAETLSVEGDRYITENLPKRLNGLLVDFKTLGNFIQTLQQDPVFKTDTRQFFGNLVRFKGNLKQTLNLLYDELLGPSANAAISKVLEAKRATGDRTTTVSEEERTRLGVRLTPTELQEISRRQTAYNEFEDEVRRDLVGALQFNPRASALTRNIAARAGEKAPGGETRGADFVRDTYTRVLGQLKAELEARGAPVDPEVEGLLQTIQGPEFAARSRARIKSTTRDETVGLVRDRTTDMVTSLAAAVAEINTFGEAMGRLGLQFDTLAETSQVMRSALRTSYGLEGDLIRQLGQSDSVIAQIRRDAANNTGVLQGPIDTEDAVSALNLLDVRRAQSLAPEENEELTSQLSKAIARSDTLKELLSGVRSGREFTLLSDDVKVQVERLLGNSGVSVNSLRDLQRTLGDVTKQLDARLVARETARQLTSEGFQLDQALVNTSANRQQQALQQAARVAQARGVVGGDIGTTLAQIQSEQARRFALTDLTRSAREADLRSQRLGSAQLNAELGTAGRAALESRRATLEESLVRVESIIAEEETRQQLARVATGQRLVGAAGSGLQDVLSDPGAFSSPALGQRLLAPLAQTLQQTVAEAFVQNLIGPNGILGQQLQSVFEQQSLFATRDTITTAHLDGARSVAQEIRSAFNDAVMALRQVMTTSSMPTPLAISRTGGGLLRAPRTPQGTVTAGAVQPVGGGAGGATIWEQQLGQLDPDFATQLRPALVGLTTAGLGFTFNSLTRTPAKNALLKGAAPDSRHLRGLAADLQFGSPAQAQRAARLLRELGLDVHGTGEHGGALHVQGSPKGVPQPRGLAPVVTTASLVAPRDSAVPRWQWAGAGLPAFPTGDGLQVNPEIYRNRMTPEQQAEAERIVAQRQAQADNRALLNTTGRQLTNQLTMLLSTQLGARLGRNSPGAQIGGTFGSAAGQTLGQWGAGKLTGEGLGAAIGSWALPVVGTVLGGMVGGWLGGRLGGTPEQAPQYDPLQRIERNTRETVTAIEQQTNQLLEVQNRFINVPAGFVVPSYRPNDVPANSTSVGSITIQVAGAGDPQAVAEAVYQRLQHEMTVEVSTFSRG